MSGAYWLYNDSNPLAYMMRLSAPSGSEQSVSGMVVNRFHSPSFASGASLAAGTTTLHIYVSNTSPMGTLIGMGLYAGEGSYTLLGSNTGSIPGGTTTPLLQTFSFNTHGYSFSEGQRLKLEVYGNFGLTIYWDGQYADSSVILP